MSSIVQYTQAMNASSDLQIWDNAAFDDGHSRDPAMTASFWSPVKPIIVNRSESLDSFSSKENQSPVPVRSPVSIKIPAPVKPLHSNGVIGNSQGKPAKLHSMHDKVVVSRRGSQEDVRDEQKINAEIEEIQMEISRLNSRLEALWLEKAEQKLKALERRGRVVPAKFMEPKQGVKIEEPNSSVSAKAKAQRRGHSLGPSEVASGVRRGVSLGPAEIFSGVKSRQLGKQEISITPVQPIQNRRKSCFWKLQGIDELKEIKERRKSMSASPKSRKITTTRGQALRQAATTVGSKKAVKKEDGLISLIQPKKLFKDGEKSSKKQLKPGRVVASRYNQHTENSAMRKRSLPENDKDDGKRRKSRESSQEGSQKQGPEIRVKKKWEIPIEILVHKSLIDEEESVESIDKITDLLPPIKTVRCTTNSPRDSGPAKKVAELVGRKSYFSTDEEDSEVAVCQALSFEEEAEEK